MGDSATYLQARVAMIELAQKKDFDALLKQAVALESTLVMRRDPLETLQDLIEVMIFNGERVSYSGVLMNLRQMAELS